MSSQVKYTVVGSGAMGLWGYGATGLRGYGATPLCGYANVFAGTRQVKLSSGATRPRGDHPDPNLLLPSSLRGLVEL